MVINIKCNYLLFLFFADLMLKVGCEIPEHFRIY